MLLKENASIVLYGDSVTDTCRFAHKDFVHGSGYAAMVISHLQTNFQHLNLKVKNLGVSGNRTCDLVRRLPEVIAEKPDIVFILIGVNDAWRKYDMGDETTHEQFRSNYCQIIDGLYQASPDVKIILLEPFTLPLSEWVVQIREDLDPKLEVIKDIAKQYQLPLVLLDEIFAENKKIIAQERLVTDGIHPTILGHALIAEQVLNILLKG